VIAEGRSSTRPTIIIEPRQGWRDLGLRELWAYRELLYFFIWRDLKVRYKQTVFGALWAIIQPLLLMVVFTLFLGRINGIAPSGVPYAIFAFSGLVPWTLFAGSLGGSAGSLVSASNLLQKVYFPRLLLPAAAIGSQVVDFVIAMGVLVLLMLYFGFVPTLAALWIVPLTALALATALAVGIGLSAINVRYRDVRYAVPFLIQVWLFATPVVYSANLIPEQFQALYRLDPMVGVIEGFRWALLGVGGPPPLGSLAVSVAITAAILVTGVAYFRRVERSFADVV
jgi:lipopolysaccharide transport system permease protein